jgi:3-oxoacyl-[acyl-carrier protein] reductase
MADRYQTFTESPPGRFITKRLGMPQPMVLRRYEPGQPLLEGPALLGAASGGRLTGSLAQVLKAEDAEA